jgi:thymidylate synthase
MEFDLREGFPLLTTKKLHIPSIVHELLWFLKGTEDVSYLRENKVRIWEEWTKPDGTVGPLYGVQWRNWNGIDQIQNAINEIKDNPSSRRIIVSAWNVSDLPDMVLNPCHAFFQFYCHGNNYENLSLQLYQRSADIFLGVPFNIASYSLLLSMVAYLTGKRATRFVWTGGDVHLYSNHFAQAVTQLNRKPKGLPSLRWEWQENYPATTTAPRTIDEFKYEHFIFKFYTADPHIKAEVAV